MSDKVFWISGASSGFGAAVAQQLLQQGHIVYVSARRVERLEALADMGARRLPLDVCCDADIQAAWQEIERDCGRIDGLLANAGFGAYGMIETLSMDAIQQQFDVNVFGVIRMIKAVLPSMRAARKGRIVITGSLASHTSMAGIGWYAATKHALQGMQVALRQELQPLGVQVAFIEPGRVHTEFDQVAFSGNLNNETVADYQAFSARLLQLMQRTGAQSSNMDRTVKAMVHALTSAKPRRRYRTTWDAHVIAPLYALSPQVVIDALMAALLKEKE